MSGAGYVKDSTKSIGRGTFGEAFSTVRKCVLKSVVINDFISEDKKQTAVEKWKKEIEKLSKVRGNVNLIEYRYSFATADKLWVELEAYDGGTLNEYVIENKPDRKTRLDFMTQISNAISFLHSVGIVHGNLKPRNILVAEDDDEEPQIKVSDYGLVKAVAACDSDTDEVNVTTVKAILERSTRNTIDTKYFLAPELDGGVCTQKSDVFAMGIIFKTFVPETQTIEIKRGEEVLVVTISNDRKKSYGEYMRATGSTVPESESKANRMGAKLGHMLASMTDFHSKRPSAEVVHNKLLSDINPSDLYILAPAPMTKKF